MHSIVLGHSALRITLRTFRDLGRAANAAIRYRKPNGRGGEFAASVDGENIFHDCTAGDIDVAGWWSFWAAVTMGDGRLALGETARVFVRRPGR